MSGVSWGLLTPDQLKTGMSQLLADAQGTDIAVKACTELDAPTTASWGTFLAAVQQFCAQNPVWFFPLASNDVLTTRGLALQWENYEQELISWKMSRSRSSSLLGYISQGKSKCAFLGGRRCSSRKVTLSPPS
jgi:hypothetical protein